MITNNQMPDGFIDAFTLAWHGIWTFVGLVLGGAFPFAIIIASIALLAWLFSTFRRML